MWKPAACQVPLAPLQGELWLDAALILATSALSLALLADAFAQENAYQLLASLGTGCLLSGSQLAVLLVRSHCHGSFFGRQTQGTHAQALRHSFALLFPGAITMQIIRTQTLAHALPQATNHGDNRAATASGAACLALQACSALLARPAYRSFGWRMYRCGAGHAGGSVVVWWGSPGGEERGGGRPQTRRMRCKCPPAAHTLLVSCSRIAANWRLRPSQQQQQRARQLSKQLFAALAKLDAVLLALLLVVAGIGAANPGASSAAQQPQPVGLLVGAAAAAGALLPAWLAACVAAGAASMLATSPRRRRGLAAAVDLLYPLCYVPPLLIIFAGGLQQGPHSIWDHCLHMQACGRVMRPPCSMPANIAATAAAGTHAT